jgi:hypothetical protein
MATQITSPVELTEEQMEIVAGGAVVKFSGAPPKFIISQESAPQSFNGQSNVNVFVDGEKQS